MPEMRAAYMQENVHALAVLGADLEATVRREANAQIEQIIAAARLAYLPVELDLAVLESIHKHGGDDKVLLHARRALLAAIDSPLLRPIKDSAIRLLGLAPESIFKWAPQAWSVTFRGCGAITWERVRPGHGRILMVDMPAVLSSSRAWMLTAQGAFEAGLQVARANDAQVTLTPVGHVVRYDLTWKA
jgi:hypothetical protein